MRRIAASGVGGYVACDIYALRATPDEKIWTARAFEGRRVQQLRHRSTIPNLPRKRQARTRTRLEVGIQRTDLATRGSQLERAATASDLCSKAAGSHS